MTTTSQPPGTDRPRGGLVAMCIAQTTSWGLLFYSLPAAVAPISRDTGWSDTAITGALSAGLIISAIAGLAVGRILDSRGPRTVMTLGAVIGVAALALVAWSPTLPMFYLAWLVAGFAQSAVLYPPAFAVITRWYGARRGGPLLTLTLVAGFSSTIFAPLTGFLIEQFGWRTSYLVMAGILAAVSVPLHAFFLNAAWSDAGEEPTVQQSRSEIRQVTRTPRFITLQVAMTVATFTLFAVTINLIPLLLERGMEYSTAVLAFGLVGAGQIIGRLGYPLLTRRTSPQLRMLLILGAGALGLWGVAVVPGPTWLLIALAVGTGAARGCHTLLQATAVSDRWGTQNFGATNAAFNAPMTAVTALAPVSGPVLAGVLGGYPAMAVGMAALLTTAAILSMRT